MKRLPLGWALLALALFPAGALAAAPRATVFSVDPHHHALQLVDAGHLVRAYRYRGRLPRLGLGDRISFRRARRTLSHVTRTARAGGTFSFYAQVLRAGGTSARLRLADGNAFTPSGAVTVRIRGLTPGATVLIRETLDARRHWTVTITLPPSATSAGTVASGDDPSADDQVAEGTIAQVSAGGLSINAAAGGLNFSVDPASGLTDGFLVGDVVDVTYAPNADGSLSADDVEYVEQDVSGTVAAVSDGRITVVGSEGGPSVTIAADPAAGLLGGVAVGDQVDVTYHQSASGPLADSLDDQSWDA
jgi:Domain of unknown function (DUF5666)